MPHVQATAAEARSPAKTVFVTGAGGFIGFAVSRAFVRAGWRVYGLVRREAAAVPLLREEITPIIGSISPDLAFLDELLEDPTTRPFDVVVSCTEQFPFDEHWTHVVALLTRIASHARRGGGAKPLVLVSSGCKDYGTTARHGEDDLVPHAEDAPLQPIDALRSRTFCSLDAFEHADLFDAAVLRPTPLFGYGGSYYGSLFEALGRLQESEGAAVADVVIKVPGHGDNIYHGCHVDDCGDAYVALAAHPVREQVSGECFNISAYRYETVGDILAALGQEYCFEGGIVATPPEEARPELRELEFTLGYTQWVNSDKIRRLTGWTDSRELFSENVGLYRLAFEAAAQTGDSGVARIRDRVAGWVASGLKFEKKTQAGTSI
ncbi:NAD(P)-binding protein [Nemania sp. NC0429]|nr:NAD(P)-binding protein [Nemania sp. NC0429]